MKIVPTPNTTLNITYRYYIPVPISHGIIYRYYDDVYCRWKHKKCKLINRLTILFNQPHINSLLGYIMR